MNKFGITLEKITIDTLDIVQEMFRSNPEYCQFVYNGHLPSISELQDEFCGETLSFFVKADETYIGLIDYLERNEKDGYPWLGLLMIHGDYHGYGYGSNTYYYFEEQMKQLEKTAIRLGVIEENIRAKSFWESVGFSFFAKKNSNKNIIVDCYQKNLS